MHVTGYPVLKIWVSGKCATSYNDIMIAVYYLKCYIYLLYFLYMYFLNFVSTIISIENKQKKKKKKKNEKLCIFIHNAFLILSLCVYTAKFVHRFFACRQFLGVAFVFLRKRIVFHLICMCTVCLFFFFIKR